MFWLLWAMMSVYWTNGINLITIVYLPSQFYNLLIHIWFISWTKGYLNYKLEIQVSGKLRNYILLTKSNNYFCKLGTKIKQSIHFNILRFLFESRVIEPRVRVKQNAKIRVFILQFSGGVHWLKCSLCSERLPILYTSMESLILIKCTIIEWLWQKEKL